MPSSEQMLKEAADKLEKRLNTVVSDLEPKIKQGVLDEIGVSELKGKVAKMSEDIAPLADQMRDLAADVKAEKEKDQEEKADLQDRLNELERQIKTRGGDLSGKELRKHTAGGALAEAIRNRFEKSQQKGSEYRGRISAKLGSWELHRMAVKEMADKAVSIASDAVVPPQYRPGIISPAERGLRIRDLLPQIPTSSNTVYFASESSTTDNAEIQASRGDAKGESSMTISVSSETVRTIAHFAKVPVQLLDDIVGLEGYINSRMQFLLDREEEDQLLYGSGSGSNLNGLMTQATAYDTTLENEIIVSSATVTDLDKLRLALAQAQTALYPPDAFVFHPYNWAAIELLKDSDQGYIFARPQDAAGPRLWGLPVVATTAMNSGDFLTGSFSVGAAIWDRMSSQVAISTEDDDNFQKNMATIRAEKRMTLTVYRTAAFIEGDFDLTVT